jgi:hypothetical protein
MLFFGLGIPLLPDNEPDTDALGVASFGFGWRVDDGPLPWKAHSLSQQLIDYIAKYGAEHDKDPKDWSIPAMLTGCQGYNGPIDLIEMDIPDFEIKYVRSVLWGQFLLIRYLLGLLATINDLPIVRKVVVPQKGFVARGRYRKFLQHTVVTLTVPTTRYKTLARKAVANLRRRAHEVRGFWREHWKHPPVQGCPHEYASVDAAHIRCTVCKGEKFWIKEHQRGDASLGFVTHEYRVKTETDHERQV